jgi:AraC-like DNA-binding protein
MNYSIKSPKDLQETISSQLLDPERNSYLTEIKIDRISENPDELNGIRITTEEYKYYTLIQWEALTNIDLTIAFKSPFPQLFFHFITCGEVEYFTKDARNILAKKGHYNLWCFDKGEVGEATLKKGKKFTSIGIYIKKSFIEMAMQTHPKLMESLSMELDNAQSIPLLPRYKKFSYAQSRILQELNEMKQFGKLANYYLSSKIHELLALYFIDFSEVVHPDNANQPTPKERKQLIQARNIILDNLQHPPKNSELAKEVGLNSCKLKTLFKALFGITIRQYIINQRMKLAQTYLTTTNYTITEIAAQLGYSSTAYFSTAYKKFYKQNPGKVGVNSEE